MPRLDLLTTASTGEFIDPSELIELLFFCKKPSSLSNNSEKLESFLKTDGAQSSSLYLGTSEGITEGST